MIFNKTKDKVIVEKVELAGGKMEKAKGLMFRKSLPRSHGMLIIFDKPSEENGIWMFCMRFPIDLVFMDSDWRVIEIHRNIKPLGLGMGTWKVYYPHGKAKYALEIAPGKAEKIDIGDILGF